MRGLSAIELIHVAPNCKRAIDEFAVGFVTHRVDKAISQRAFAA